MIYDVIMAGGGVMGCATAYYLLLTDPTLKVAIVEKDPSYVQSSTVLSDGNIRVQFNLKENIQISLYGLEMLARFSEDMAVDGHKPAISFRQEGNLFLTDEAGRDDALAGMRLQQSLGGQVEWFTSEQVVARWPFIDPATVAGGTFGSQDGTMDPQAVLQGYRNKAIDLGATYITGEVAAVIVENRQVQGIRLADGSTLQSRYVVNSSGAWGTQLARTIGVELPMQPVKRHVFILETPVQPEHTVPLTVFPSGLYIIHEHERRFMVGKSLPDDLVGFDFTFNRQVFLDGMWEDLAHYIPAFDQVKIVGGWAGLYAVNTLDGNAILGEWPEIKGFILVNGFSGHGFQQCCGVGRYLAEIILGREPALDLSIFSPARILRNTPVYENRHRIV